MHHRFRDRIAAGRALSLRLQEYVTAPNLIILAPPRGGVLIGSEVARQLGASFDAIVIRRLASPANNQIALGAVGPWGAIARNEAVISSLQLLDPAITEATRRERETLERRTRWYRSERPLPELESATVILVDDGIVTGATMEAAARAVRSQHPVRLIVAAPVASSEAVERLRATADAIVTLVTVPEVYALADYYEDFRQPDDLELRWLLAGKPRMNAV